MSEGRGQRGPDAGRPMPGASTPDALHLPWHFHVHELTGIWHFAPAHLHSEGLARAGGVQAPTFEAG